MYLMYGYSAYQVQYSEYAVMHQKYQEQTRSRAATHFVTTMSNLARAQRRRLELEEAAAAQRAAERSCAHAASARIARRVLSG